MFTPEDKVRNVSVRVLEGRPYGFILGASFLPKHGSVVNFAEGGGFKPAPESPWVPFLSCGGGVTSKENNAIGWKPALTRPGEGTRVDTVTWENVCAFKPRTAIRGGVRGESCGEIVERCSGRKLSLTQEVNLLDSALQNGRVRGRNSAPGEASGRGGNSFPRTTWKEEWGWEWQRE